jgi:microcompartment protein CcmL/EutN
VHDAIIPGLGGSVDADEPDTLGVVEGRTIATTLVACDAALKEASVRLAGLRVVTGLGGKAYFVVHGSHSDVEAALEASAAKLGDALVELQCIPVPHEDFIDVLLRPPPFRLG